MLRKVFFAFGVLSLSVWSVQAQSDQANVEWYEHFFDEKEQKPLEEALRLAESTRLKAMESKDKAAEAKALTGLGLFNLIRVNDYEQALGWLIRAVAIEDSLQLRKEEMFTYLAMARVFEEVGDYNKSTEFLTHARSLNDSHTDPLSLALILSESGRVHAANGKIEEAFADYDLLLEYAQQLRQSGREADALFYLGKLLTRQRKFNEALESHKKALALRRKLNDKDKEAISLNEIGELYRSMRNPERSLANHVAALDIRQQLKDTRGMSESYNNIGGLYNQQSNYARAIANLELALKAGQEGQVQSQLVRTYDYLAQAYKGLKEYKLALQYRESYQAISELIQNEKNEHQLLETQNKYVIGKKESEIDHLENIRAEREAKIEDQRKLNILLFMIIGVGLIFIMLILYFFFANRRANKRLQVANATVQQQNEELIDLNATKDKFFSIIGHDLKGPLNSLTSFSGLLINHTDSLTKEEIKMLAKDLDKSLKNLFALLENLLEWSRSQTGAIEFKPEPFDLSALLEENKELLKTQAQNKNITIQFAKNGEIKVNAHKHSVNTVVRNLLANAIKFTPAEGIITLHAQQAKEEVMISVQDTGVGISKEAQKKLFRIDTKHSTKGTAEEKGTGIGLILCKEFIEKNGGSIGVKSEEGKGSVFYFTLPAR